MHNSTSRLTALILTVALMTVPGQAWAYVGPGLGAGAIGAVLGVLGSIFLGLFAVIYYPFKRLMKKRAKKKQDGGPE